MTKETQFICEGDVDTLKLIQLLQDESIKGEERKALKQIAYPYLYGRKDVGINCLEQTQEELITYVAGNSQLSCWPKGVFNQHENIVAKLLGWRD